MTRRQERGVGIVLIFVLAALLVYLGWYKGWTINLLPAQYLGYFVAGIGVAGLAGVNIWYKGPLDPADDAKSEEAGDDAPGTA